MHENTGHLPISLFYGKSHPELSECRMNEVIPSAAIGMHWLLLLYVRLIGVQSKHNMGWNWLLFKQNDKLAAHTSRYRNSRNINSIIELAICAELLS